MVNFKDCTVKILGIYLGVEGAGTNMSDIGGLIVYEIIG